MVVDFWTLLYHVLKSAFLLFSLAVFPEGYIEAAVIPVGARRIKVVEDQPSHSFLGKSFSLCNKDQTDSPCPLGSWRWGVGGGHKTHVIKDDATSFTGSLEPMTSLIFISVCSLCLSC